MWAEAAPQTSCHSTPNPRDIHLLGFLCPLPQDRQDGHDPNSCQVKSKLHAGSAHSTNSRGQPSSPKTFCLLPSRGIWQLTAWFTPSPSPTPTACGEKPGSGVASFDRACFVARNESLRCRRGRNRVRGALPRERLPGGPSAPSSAPSQPGSPGSPQQPLWNCWIWPFLLAEPRQRRQRHKRHQRAALALSLCVTHWDLSRHFHGVRQPHGWVGGEDLLCWRMEDPSKATGTRTPRSPTRHRVLADPQLCGLH